MTISSRTPEGLPSRCPLCGAKTNIDYSDTGGDAPCPKCGHLLLTSSRLLRAITRQFQDVLNTSEGVLDADTKFSELGSDSLDTVELVMELEEEYGVMIPDEIASEFKTVGDVVRYIESFQKRRGD